MGNKFIRRAKRKGKVWGCGLDIIIRPAICFFASAEDMQ